MSPKMVSCPTCRKSIPYEDNPHRPFCSKRCRVMDLGAWAEEAYRVPAEESAQSLEADLEYLSDESLSSQKH